MLDRAIELLPSVYNLVRNHVMQRTEALQLIEQFGVSPRLKAHLLAVEAAVRHYAVKNSANPDLWGLAGLLHDADWEAHPADHPQVIIQLLRERGEQELAVAINGHGGKGAIARTTNLSKVLFACDELSGFIVAYSYLKPGGISQITAAKVLKKLKDKSFAATVSRVDIDQGAKEVGLIVEQHVAEVLLALQAAATSLPSLSFALHGKA